jgi:hypothetical protein
LRQEDTRFRRGLIGGGLNQFTAERLRIRQPGRLTNYVLTDIYMPQMRRRKPESFLPLKSNWLHILV